MHDLKRDFLRYLAQTSDSPIGLEIERAEGSWLYCSGGQRYLDFISGIGVSNLGHGNPEVLGAIERQAKRHLHAMVYGEYVQRAQVELAARLAGVLPPSLNRIYLTNSGAEAIEGAMKVARKHTGRAGFVAFDGCYHGDTTGAMALGGNPVFRSPFGTLIGPVRHLPYGEAGELRRIDDSIAAVVVEPIQAEGGVRIPSLDFMGGLRRRCDEVGATLVFDEVLTGFGRTGRLFGFEHFGVVPDLIVLAKALGGGLPLGAFCGSDQRIGTLAHDPPLGHITTFGGHPLSCAAGLAALNVTLREKLWERAALQGAKLIASLRDLVAEQMVAVRGMGLLIGIEFRAPALAQAFVARTIERGVIINWTLNAERVVRLAPPLTIGDEELEFALHAMGEALRELR
ncbi:MAG TPA: aspartate aminotransferase family protein [Candidatus Binataceae bacterium]|jgi:acetylornithine/succinyldiaminopimelate/putrescine aminotransferase